MKNVQIPYDLFLALLQYHLMMEDGYEDEIRYGLEQKLEAMVRHELYAKATPRNDMKKPHHLPISANCGGGSAYFRCMGKLNQAGKQRLSARIRFASANNIFNFAVCFRRPRYRVFRYRNRPFTTPKTCSTFARTDDFSCSLRFN